MAGRRRPFRFGHEVFKTTVLVTEPEQATAPHEARSKATRGNMLLAITMGVLLLRISEDDRRLRHPGLPLPCFRVVGFELWQLVVIFDPKTPPI